MNIMRIIGVTGGGSLCELGTAMDVQLFFDCLDMYIAQKQPEQDWSVLSDRLYRRYLKLEELDKATSLMNEVKRVFAGLTNKAINWQGMAVGDAKTWLDPRKGTLDQIFGKYFESFALCIESAKLSYEGFKSYPGYKYEGVRLVIADQPWFLVEKQRSLEEYDALEGAPFWGR
jgi:hypothetical protein